MTQHTHLKPGTRLKLRKSTYAPNIDENVPAGSIWVVTEKKDSAHSAYGTWEISHTRNDGIRLFELITEDTASDVFEILDTINGYPIPNTLRQWANQVEPYLKKTF